MLKKLLLLGCLWGLLVGDGFAQTSGQFSSGGTATAKKIVATSVAPTSCTYSATADPVKVYQGTLYVCSTGDAFVAVSGGGGSGTVTSVGLAGTSNQIIVTGSSPITGSGSWTLSLPSTLVLPNGAAATTQSQLDGSTKVATTAYTDTAVSNAIAAVNPAIAVQVATTASSDTSALTYNNGASGIGATFTGANNTAITIDGVTFTTVGQRLLVKNDTQSPSGAFNGIYQLTAVHTAITGDIYTRVLDYNTPSEMNNTGAIPVQSGTANGSTSWLMTSQIVTVGTTPLTFVQFSYAPSAIPTLAGNNAFTGSNSFTKNINALSFSTTNAGVAGLFSWGQGTVPPLFSASVNVFAPTSVTAYGVQLAAAAPAAASYSAYSAPSNGVLTFNATPTAGGSAYTQGDVGSLLTLTCGATVAITQVNSGSGTGGVTAIATAATTPGTGCSSGTGQTTTGGTGTGATLNVTALVGISTQSFVAVVPTPTTRGTVLSASVTASPASGGTTATGVTTQNHIRLFSIILGQITTGHFAIHVAAADNSANSYDIGLYGPGCNGGASNVPLAAHTGTIAGSSFASATGFNQSIQWAQTYDIPAGWYCLAFTSSAASPLLNLGGLTNSSSPSIFTTSNTTTGGGATLPSTITAPAGTTIIGQAGNSTFPSFIFYQ